MDYKENKAEHNIKLSHQEGAIRNERFVEQCLKRIYSSSDAEEGLRRLLKYLGETLQCERVYVFEEMDRQHICNSYEWCKEGVPSGIKQLPYLTKKDLFPWYGRLLRGENIIDPNVEALRITDPLIYDFLKPQEIRTIVLSPLITQGRMVGLFGADNPPPENMEHISVLFDVLAYFVSSLLNQRELFKLRKAQIAHSYPKTIIFPGDAEKTVLLVDDSPELLRLNKRILRTQGYRILSAGTLRAAKELLASATPSVIVMDIDLPDGDGIEFCKELQRKIPVVFLTARSDEQAVRKSLQAGGFAFLTKPYQLEDLQSAVEQAMEGLAAHG